MSYQSVDKRVIRTKRMIRDALTELIQEKGFEGITVRDLTTKANINRGTFYLHYRDKYDLLEQSEAELIQGIQSFAKQLDPITGVTYHLKNEPLPFVVKLFEYLEEHADFIKVILGPKGDPAFQAKLKEVMRENMLEKLVKQLKTEKMLVPVDYFTSFFISAYLGVIQKWLENGMKQSPREMSVILSKMVFLGILDVVGIKDNLSM